MNRITALLPAAALFCLCRSLPGRRQKAYLHSRAVPAAKILLAVSLSAALLTFYLRHLR